MKKPASICAFLLLLGTVASLSHEACAIILSVAGGWNPTINATNLTGGAGSDLQGTYLSPADAVALTVSGTSGSWTMSVSKVDGHWDSDLGLSVKRTSSGTPEGYVSGGTSFQSLTGVSASFFNGSGNISSIGLQLQLSGVSLKTIPAGAYSTTIYYTVLEN